MAGKVKKAPKRKGANGYKLPDPISPGEILKDLKDTQWVLGKSIGVGGFGEIYCAAPYTGKFPKDYPNVIKIEPHGNGPLFVEMHFYMRNAKPDEINAWRKKKKLSRLGMPPYLGSGSHEYKNTKYRFIVLERYGVDLWKLFEQNKRQFPEHTVYKVALQIINVLEYIHSRKYIHGDIKGANLLLDLKLPDQVYLVDFGLASRLTTKDKYELDPKKAHNGTIEYVSRDGHMGVSTMRGDLEILGYNMIQWLNKSLLWEKDLSSPVIVQKQKEEAFKNIPAFLKKTFTEAVPSPILRYMSELASMKFNGIPDYDKFKQILTEGLKQLSHKPDGKLEFESSPRKREVFKSTTPLKSTKPTVDNTRKSPRTRKPIFIEVESDEESRIRIVKRPKKTNSNSIKKEGNDQDKNDNESGEEFRIKIIKKTKKTSTKTLSGRTARMNYEDENDESDEVLSKKTVKRTKKINSPTVSGRAAKVDYQDENEDESDEVLSKKIVKGTKKTNSHTVSGRAIKMNYQDENEDESDEELPMKIVKRTKNTNSNTVSGRTAKVNYQDENEDESDEELPMKIVKRTKNTNSNTVSGRTAKMNYQEESEDESDEELPTKIVKRTKNTNSNTVSGRTAKVNYQEESEDESDEELPMKIVKRTKKTNSNTVSGRTAKLNYQEESEDESDEELPMKIIKKTKKTNYKSVNRRKLKVADQDENLDT
ncbi:uncharacterized protein LOC117217540 [Megalopta genalis]|uniref:uncharacterized protein LOC117217540 n=1 Tax=Megalopta genalis TaxID=115081 RepID=UPI003FD5D538